MKGGFNEFKEALAKRESGGKYNIVNKFGFLGKYQFGKSRLYDLGLSIDGYGVGRPAVAKEVKKISQEEFLKNPELQEQIFLMHIKELKERVLKKYPHLLGKKIRGVKLTLSGIVAGIHLLGEGNFRKWLAGGNPMDGFGTKIEEYLTTFADYDLSDL